jgi:hypothetical protein
MTRVDQLPLAGPSLQLEYARPTDGLARRDWWWGVFLVALLPAAVSPFVQFASSTSPLDTLIEYAGSVRRGDWNETGFFLLGAPFFTAVPLWLLHARQLLWPGKGSAKAGAGERIAAYSIAAVSLAATSWVVVAVLWQGESDREAALGAVGVTVAGMLAFGRAWRRSRELAAGALIALMTAYASNGLMVLTAFRASDDVGYFLTIAALVVMAIETTFLLRRRPIGGVTSD